MIYQNMRLYRYFFANGYSVDGRVGDHAGDVSRVEHCAHAEALEEEALELRVVMLLEGPLAYGRLA